MKVVIIGKNDSLWRDEMVRYLLTQIESIFYIHSCMLEEYIGGKERLDIRVTSLVIGIDFYHYLKIGGYIAG